MVQASKKLWMRNLASVGPLNVECVSEGGKREMEVGKASMIRNCPGERLEEGKFEDMITSFENARAFSVRVLLMGKKGLDGSWRGVRMEKI